MSIADNRGGPVMDGVPAFASGSIPGVGGFDSRPDSILRDVMDTA